MFERFPTAIVSCLLAGLLLAPTARGEDLYVPPPPEELIKQLVAALGLRVELVAAEPEVVDPVEVRFDEDGRMWVVEMRDYPWGPKEGEKPRSRIRILEDKDEDGRYETATTFADELLFPTGLQPWKGGVFVTLSGRVEYMKDTDGDGRADLRETWFTGFAEQNSQLRANHPRLLMDGWIYVSGGLRGGKIVNARAKDAPPVSIDNRDFRFHPVTGACEAVTGNGQFGMGTDDWGNRFVCMNSHPLTHVVIDERYARRNPRAAIGSLVHHVCGPGMDTPLFPLARQWTTSSLHQGQFTAACGLHIYRGDALGKSYYGNAFVCEPTGSLIHREAIEPDGATFRRRPDLAEKQGTEFLASRSEWFRPVNLETGPDGALYVVDICRWVIEHPEWMPVELKNRPDQKWGDRHGRIWRVVREDIKKDERPTRERLARLAGKPSPELLAHNNGWWRDTAARLLYERAEQDQQSELAKTVGDAKRSAVARVQALCLLENLGQLDDALLVAAVKCKDVNVARQAMILSEPRLAQSAALRKALVNADTVDERSRFQQALSVGAVGRLPEEAANEAWIEQQRAILAGAHEGIWGNAALQLSAADAYDLLTVKPAVIPPAMYRALAARVAAQRDQATVLKLIRNVQQDGSPQLLRYACLGIAEGLRRRGSSLGRLIAQSSDEEDVHATLLKLVSESANRIKASDESVAADDLLLARYAPAETIVARLTEVLRHGQSEALRTQVIDAFGSHDDPRIAVELLKRYYVESPQVQRTILDALLSNKEHTSALLAQLEQGTIKPTEIDVSRQYRLRTHRDESIRRRAGKIFDAATADRQQVIADYRPALKLKADPQRGGQLFAKHCATCHRIGSVGVNVGPDISDLRTRTPEQILGDVLNPSRAIDAAYVAYAAVDRNGQSYAGVVASETDAAITLRLAEGKQVTLLKSELEELRNSGISLMPDGMEKSLDPQQMADLIGYLKRWRYLDGQVPAAP